MSDVFVVRFLTGEDILTDDIEQVDTNKYKLHNPTRMVFGQGEDGQVGCKLVKWCMFGKEESITVNGSTIMYQTPVVDEIRDEYNRIHSNLTVPNQELVLPQ